MLQTQLRRPVPHRSDTKLDVLIEFDTQACGTVHDVVAIHRPGERFIFQLLPYRLHIHFVDASRRLHVRDRCQKARQLIAF